MTEKQVVKYDIAEAEISKMAEIYMDLTIKDIDDTGGFKDVKEARLIVKGKRCAVENQRKVYKKDALEYGRRVDGEAKRIFALLEPIESYLQAEEGRINNEIAAIRAEEERKEKERIQARVDELRGYDFTMEFFTVATMTDEAYTDLLQTVKATHEAEQAKIAEEARLEQERKDKEEADRKAEDERLAKQKAEQDAEAARLKKIADEQAAREAALQAAQDKVDAANREADEKRWRNRLAFLYEVGWNGQEAFDKKTEEAIFTYFELVNLSDAEFYKVADTHNTMVEARNKENAEHKAKEAAEKAEREAEEKAEEERKAAEEAARQEALKPDKEKLEDFADMLLNITRPPLSEPKAQRLGDKAVLAVYDIGEHVRAETRGL